MMRHAALVVFLLLASASSVAAQTTGTVATWTDDPAAGGGAWGGGSVTFSASFVVVGATWWTVTFKAITESTYPIKQYAWDFGDGSPPLVTTEKVVSHDFSRCGPTVCSYVVKMSAMDMENNIETHQENVVVDGRGPFAMALIGIVSALAVLAWMDRWRRRRR